MDRTPINDLVMQRTGGVVQSGPFQGMRLLPDSSWGDGDITPKLLGVYEQELHAILQAAIAAPFEACVNIGSAEGFYAVGLARHWPGRPVYAFDLDPRAAALVQRNAQANGVADQVHAKGACGPAELVALAQSHPNMFVICDCEGYEIPLFADPTVPAALQRADLLIECHDFINPNCTPYVFSRLWATHLIEVIYPGARDPGRFAMLSRLSDAARWMAICENRPALMNWLYCRAR